MGLFQNTRQPDWDWWSKLWPTPGATLRRLGITAGATVAEVPSGNGYFALPVARIAEPATVYAIDLDTSLLEELDEIATQQGIENVETRQADAREFAQHLPEPVDVVLLANTFHGIDDTDAVVRQAFDALHPGGQFVVCNWAAEPRETTTIDGEPRGPPTELRVTPEQTVQAVTDVAGFERRDEIDLPPYHYALRFER